MSELDDILDRLDKTAAAATPGDPIFTGSGVRDGQIEALTSRFNTHAALLRFAREVRGGMVFCPPYIETAIDTLARDLAVAMGDEEVRDGTR